MSNEHLAFISGHETTKAGWVIKRAGVFFKSWERRWFVVRGDKLLYYKNDQMAKTYPQLPRNVFHMKKADVYRAAEGKIESPTEFCIEILFHPSVSAQLDHPKSYYFCLDSESEMEEWLAALEKARHFVGHLPASLEAKRSKKEDGSASSAAPSSSSSSSSSSPSGWGAFQVSPLSPYDAAANMMAGFSTPPKADESETLLRLIVPPIEGLSGHKRPIIRRGPMEVADVSADGDHKKKKRFSVLLNGIFLVTKRKESYFALKLHITLSLGPIVEKSSSNPDEILFKTKTCSKTFSITLENEQQRDAWAADLAAAIAEACPAEAREEGDERIMEIDHQRSGSPDQRDSDPLQHHHQHHALQIGEL